MYDLFNVKKERFFPLLTHEQVTKMENKENVVLVLPLGTVEQHGNHLPLFTDSIISTNIIFNSLNQLDKNVKAYALAPLYYGKSNEHSLFAGTMTISANTLQNQLMELVESIYTAGFRKLIFANGHGGQPQILEIVARDILVNYQDMLIISSSIGAPWKVPEELWPSTKEKSEGIHGGFIETSIILGFLDKFVDMSKAVGEYPEPYDSKFLTLEGGISPSWLTQHLSKSGIIGDPSQASKEAGKRIIDGLTIAWSELIEDIFNFKRPSLKVIL